MTAPRTAEHSGINLLRCLALAPPTHGVLFIDLDPAMLRPLGRWLADAVTLTSGKRPDLVTLGPWHTEDDLWTTTKLTGTGVEVGPGLLVESPAEPPPIILIPNLATTGLAVHRAAVSLIGADSATSERNGRTFTWVPRARWLAACGWDDAARLSPHLLDRFTIRCDGKTFDTVVRAAAIQAARDGTEPDDPDRIAGLLGPADVSADPTRPTRPVQFTNAAIDRVVELSPPATGLRRDLTLARLSRAVAILRGASSVTPDEVGDAAALLGFTPQAGTSDLPTSGPDQTPPPAAVGGPEPPDRQQPLVPGPRPEGEPEVPVQSPVLAGNPPQPLDEFTPTSTGIGLLYPEDDPEALAESAPLRLLWQRQSALRAGRGQIIGVEPTRDLHDFAIVATLFEALKFQAVRGRGAADDSRRLDDSYKLDDTHRLIVSSSDLRRYRRHPEPTAALVLVLDHTCRRTWDCAPALAPYLRWAYSARALVSVVEFGHDGAEVELRAERYRARSLLDPRIADSLNRMPGRASPLAYAVDLAADELRHLVRRGRAPVNQALLVIVTDGRGNVPLDASVRDRVTEAVGHRGVTDAVEAAGALIGLRGVTAVVLAPDVAPYPHLPFDLAEAMGGVVMTPATSSTDSGPPASQPHLPGR